MINKKRSRNDWIKPNKPQGKFVIERNDGALFLNADSSIKIFDNIFVAQDYIRVNHITGFIPIPYNDDT